MKKFCCKKFEEEAGGHQAFAGGGLGYPDPPDAQFEKDEDGTWNVNGCCGGGCFVITEMKFCPFCGTKVEEPKTK